MRLLFFFSAILLVALQSFAVDHESLKKNSQDYIYYTSQYIHPEIFMDNEAALLARLKLLDQLPSGAQAKIMTFVYENGHATKLLAAHMCLAARRGVKVQLLPDSKTGDRPGITDVFDSPSKYQMNEEVYQMLVNCGVAVRIHNHISDDQFQILVTKPIAVPLLPHKKTSYVLSYFTERLSNLWALENMRDDLNDLINEEFKKIDTASRPSVEKLKETFKSILRSTIVSYISAESSDQKVDAAKDALQKIRDLALDQKAFAQLDTKKVKIFLNTFIQKLQSHPRLGSFYNGIRIFNRLNHRKLFWVSYQGQNCMFVGGRNLSDHYLSWNRHQGDPEFIDADVLVCSHQISKQDTAIFSAAQKSFDQIWFNQDLEDPLGLTPQITILRSEPNYEYQYLLMNDQIVSGWGNPLWIFTPRHKGDNQEEILVPMRWRLSKNKNYGDLSREERLIPEPILWEDDKKISGLPMEDTYGWNFLTTTWIRAKDQVRAELYRALDREQEMAYIETAYSEMSTGFRNKIEKTLRRGVKVELVTNSIFVSDAGSKAIRLVMARWTRMMLEKYPHLFNVKFANLQFGHMIHFKGASFKCQVVSTPHSDSVYRFNLIGSHNFHGRSGYTDKEHALSWRQGPQTSCAIRFKKEASSAPDLKDFRDHFYSELAKTVSPERAPLKTYYTFEEEITDAISSHKLSPQRLKIVQWALFVLYEHNLDPNGKYVLVRDQNGRARLRTQDEFIRFLEAVSESSLGDLIGTLL